MDYLKVDHSVRRWSIDHLEAAAFMQILHNEGVRFGMFCSQAVRVYSAQVGAHQPKKDVDLMVHPDDFGLVVKIAQKHGYPYDLKYDAHFENFCRGGGTTYHIIDRLKISVGKETVDICHPTHPILFKSDVASHIYNWSMTNTAYEMCQKIVTKNGIVSLAPAFDCMALYVILQRLDKDDYLSAMTVAQSTIDLDSEYVRLRLAELCMDGDERTQQYLSHIQATVISVNNALANHPPPL
jgi:hypothetical protein